MEKCRKCGQKCGQRLPDRPPGPGRPKVYCSAQCRRAAEYERIAVEIGPLDYAGLAPVNFDGLVLINDDDFVPINDDDLAKMKPLLDQLVGLVPPFDDSEEETP